MAASGNGRMHVRIDVALHVGGPVCNVVCPSTICYVHPWNEWHIHNRNGFEEDIDGVLGNRRVPDPFTIAHVMVTSESVTLADVNRTSRAITESVSCCRLAGKGCESSRRGKTKGTHRSSATSEDHCHRRKITSLIDAEGELSETHKFATTKLARPFA
ncbi:hypothetical protein OUZ56_019547 [Daphnia magna]|uniref:Peptidase M20 dimerisation domain-containing protein n=1 Tax=Daphnia magna TaxID=35525 RepID=A0ABQ9ZCH7_9CRUS|nr:hypothetical protein OUZ56_019547 [Daphnia magna]